MTRSCICRVSLPAVCASALLASAVFGRTISVTSYGATPNDGTDDAAAINNAIAAALPGDTVVLPAGVFSIGSQINARSNIDLSGGGQNNTTLRYIGTSSNVMLALEGVSSINVGNLTLDGNSSPNVSQGVYAFSASGLNLHDLTVANLPDRGTFGPHGVYFARDVTQSIVSASTFTNIGAPGMWGAGIRVAQGSSFNQIVGNTISNTGRGGILCDDKSTDLLIKGNTVSSSGVGAGEGLGIELFAGCDRAVVEDNRIDHWLSVDGSNQVALRRNVVSDKTGVYKFAGIEMVDSRDNIVTDNLIDGGEQIGISISGAKSKQHGLWSHNTVRGASTWGMQIQGETGSVTEQYFYANAFSGSLSNSPATLFAPQGHGIRVNGDTTRIMFKDNTISDNQGMGIQLAGSNVSTLDFVGNSITANAAQAIDAGTASNLRFSNNDVSSNGSNLVPSSTATLSPIEMAFAAPQTVAVGQPVQFVLDVPTPPYDTRIDGILWDFGDGAPSTTIAPSHVYAAPGTYRVTMVAWDANGLGSMEEMNLLVTAGGGSSSIVPEPALGGIALLGAMWVATTRRNRR